MRSEVKKRRAEGWLTGLAILAGAMWASPSWAETARFTRTEGSVEVLPPGGTQWQPADARSPILVGASLRTGSDSRAILEIGGHRIAMRPATEALVSAVGAETGLTLNAGRLRAKVQKLGRGRKFYIRTPAALAAVRGTEFEVSVEAGGHSRVDVFEGVVSVSDLAGAGAEVQVVAGQTVSVEPGRPISAPEQIGGEQQGRAAETGELKGEMAREVGLDMRRDMVEAAAAQELKQAEYQLGKTLVDAFGERVRLEEYIVRPTPESFKMVALNARPNRFDFGFMEVVANKPLPEDLGLATSQMWFKEGDAPPEWYTTKYRLFMSNTVDSFSEMGVGGTPQKVMLQDFTFDPNTGHVIPSGKIAWETVFAHQYSFLNAGEAAMNTAWNWQPGQNPLTANPNQGILSHRVPLAMSQNGFLGSWRYAEVDGVTEFRQFQKPASPTLAEFTEIKDYHAYSGSAGKAAFYWNGSGFVSPGGGNDWTGTTWSGTAYFDGQQLGTKLATTKFTRMTIDENGQIFDFSTLGNRNEMAGQKMADLFQKLNFEIVLESDRLKHPSGKIDLVISPQIMLDAGLVPLKEEKGPPSPPGAL